MRRKAFISCAGLALLLTAALAHASSSGAGAASRYAPAAPPVIQGGNVGINGFLSVNKAQRGGTFQAAIVLDIPGGLHVNANRPLARYAVATKVTVDAPRGLRVGPVSYPRGTVRGFEFTDEKIAVYEGRTVLRFNVTVPPGFETGVARLRVRVRYQSCTDDLCYPPATHDMTLPITVVGANESVQRINGQLFGGGGRRRKG